MPHPRTCQLDLPVPVPESQSADAKKVARIQSLHPGFLILWWPEVVATGPDPGVDTLLLPRFLQLLALLVRAQPS